MGNWTLTALGLEGLDPAAHEVLGAMKPAVIRRGTVLFRPGDTVEGFVMILSGRIGVYLTGPNGRELLLYSVSPGETCVQTTVGLLGDELYTGEAITESEISAVMVPKPVFLSLMASSDGFRAFVFRAFAERLHAVMQVLEKVAFVTIEARLARCLLDRSVNGLVSATHQELATIIGSSREVVSRRLEQFAKLGFVSIERGEISILDPAALALRAG